MANAIKIRKSWHHVTNYVCVMEAIRQGRIAHHHTDVTFPPIVTLLGLTNLLIINQINTKEKCSPVGVTPSSEHFVYQFSDKTV